MALQAGIRVSHGDVFPFDAMVFGDKSEPVTEWTDDGKPAGQQLDKLTGLPLWSVRVFDPDPNARKGQAEVTVKIASVTEPVLPPAIPGMPFRPVVFEGLTVTPYVKTEGRPRVAFSLRATGLKAASVKRGE